MPKFLDEQGLFMLVADIKAEDKKISDKLGVVPEGKTLQGQIAALQGLMGETDVDSQISTAINALDSTVASSNDSQISVSITEENGKLNACTATLNLTECSDEEINALFE